VLSILPPVHIVIAFTSQVLSDLKDGFQVLKERYPNQLPSMINIATGPSRTADIEKTLVVGVHGPKEVYVYLVDESI
jgi:L-lactate dehydrogenase complex protein LldG